MFKSWREDLQAVILRDPAVKSKLEAMLFSSGFHAVTMHRVAHFLYNRKLKFIAKLISFISRFLTGIEIHPAAVIGRALFIDHGTGVVIGETAIVGDHVTIYQGVTLGGTGKETGKRHPTIGNHVIVSSGAKVLGPFTVGDYAKIGAGAVVLKEVPPHCTVVGIPGKIVKRAFKPKLVTEQEQIDLNHNDLPDPVNETIKELTERLNELESMIISMEEQSRKIVKEKVMS